MNPTSTPRIAIVGAGVGGLACARGLQFHGHDVTVFERETSPDARWQGGMLDLHAPTGQAALRSAGLFDEFRALARPDAQELRGLDPVTAALLHHERPVEGEHSAPEIDRGQLRDLLLGNLSRDTVRWGHPVDRVTPRDGGADLHFADGATAAFDLVVGADGAWSRVRPAVSPAIPTYSGSTMIETFLDDVDTRHPAIAALIGPGTMAAKAGRTMLSAQRNDGGHVRIYAGLEVPVDWFVAAGVDLDDTADVRAYLLTQFAGWHETLLDLVRHSDGGFVNRPLHVLPVGHTWSHIPGVTLLGDAAHLMPPYGVGANLALLDGTDLATALATSSSVDDAVRAYEDIMFPRSTAAAKACDDLTTIMAGDAAHDVAAARKHLNESVATAISTRG